MNTTTFSPVDCTQGLLKEHPSCLPLSLRRTVVPFGGARRRSLLSSSRIIVQAASFRPCIDIHQGRVKQIVGSSLKDLAAEREQSSQDALVVNFDTDLRSSFFAKLYQNSDLKGGHVVMLGSDQASRYAAYEALMAYPGGLQIGGGVTTDNALEYLNAGASHVIVTSFVFREGRLEEERLQSLVKLVGKERLVLDLSCRKRDGQYYVVTDRWQRFSELAVDQRTLNDLAGSCAEFLVHGVDVEGMQLGVDEELVHLLGQASPIPVTYAGGVRSLDDLERVKTAGSGRVDITVGSALDIFGGKLPYGEVLAWHKQQQSSPQGADRVAA
ncbi:phosphoribosylformimino-5-aminoimidazole carboxamide ribonucleotide isomerase [Coccomyxa subellipsoidea C-169]|uniref:1-(5-phosphoribosyl)-5-[(5-phosphoribosylamino)methylideneamino] imidazole-4-carboxamide isomerase HISN3, chloroplastic n=1 Tax=Coccomyxa subellipsoidea (strain C-169) TaxID=574566 RepID=I0YPB1_COCSC|nr:phosphoribosylformimino-5-aminoimidazole carboxamide ribonucleotide isomerase [Coccomyxa subellipsoidea C-169]EIE20230.1 phosphoribosylformimino-5-aminoimidazole carboxamide ribonucleotide isomerase [Coccomyxa subellipsoidea C-169]|eukprot:XP_005644774.1 phosphoribosylformimino-5-aminoimidazole carboxamide ribonucleotide isomerase [Coccomyxa subellipsoidea C-169]